jgi:hypothetical protein
MNISEIALKEDYVLYIKSDDGLTGLFDVKPYLDSEAFAPLKSSAEFERIRNGRYFIEWDCGADLSADTIEARWQPTQEKEGAQQSAAEDALASRR